MRRHQQYNIQQTCCTVEMCVDVRHTYSCGSPAPSPNTKVQDIAKAVSHFISKCTMPSYSGMSRKKSADVRTKSENQFFKLDSKKVEN